MTRTVSIVQEHPVWQGSKLASLTISRKMSTGSSSKVSGPFRSETLFHSRSLSFRYLETVVLDSSLDALRIEAGLSIETPPPRNVEVVVSTSESGCSFSGGGVIALSGGVSTNGDDG